MDEQNHNNNNKRKTTNQKSWSTCHNRNKLKWYNRSTPRVRLSSKSPWFQLRHQGFKFPWVHQLRILIFHKSPSNQVFKDLEVLSSLEFGALRGMATSFWGSKRKKEKKRNWYNRSENFIFQVRGINPITNLLMIKKVFFFLGNRWTPPGLIRWVNPKAQ